MEAKTIPLEKQKEKKIKIMGSSKNHYLRDEDSIVHNNVERNHKLIKCGGPPRGGYLLEKRPEISGDPGFQH